MAAATGLTIATAGSAPDIATVRLLFEEYAASLGADGCFQEFEQELATLPGRYAPPDGRLLLARDGSEVAGCVALRRLEAGICEMKRLYIRDAFRGRGLGRMLVEALAQEARVAGYGRMRLDTLPTLGAAIALYRQLGFREIPPYCAITVEGTLFLELQLDRSAT
ncbi:MAG: GNAT family N-acetyltransferase [Gemmatimonadales bacterium]